MVELPIDHGFISQQPVELFLLRQKKDDPLWHRFADRSAAAVILSNFPKKPITLDVTRNSDYAA
jgi:hypothetical protein